MFDFVFTVLAVALGVILAVFIFDGAGAVQHAYRVRTEKREALRLAQEEARRQERNQHLRLEFVQDGWKPPAGWSINDEGDWIATGWAASFTGGNCPADAPDEALAEAEKKEDSYW